MGKKRNKKGKRQVFNKATGIHSLKYRRKIVIKDEKLRRKFRNLKHVDPFYIRQKKQGLKFILSKIIIQ
jgi:hypothetical protein